MSALTTDQIITLTEMLTLLIGIVITWAVYYGSERAELPGEAQIPDPSLPDESGVDTRGRTLT
jgi:hypothetical protein